MTKEDLKIVFLGTPEFAEYSLRAIHEAGFNIVGVVTMPDKPAGRGHKLLQSPVKQYAVAHCMHLMQPANLKDEAFVEELKALNADLFVVIAFRMLPKVVWQMPPLGTFNLHASLLPRYRGAAPINHAVMNGDSQTGVTTFFLKHEIDTGDIIAQKAIAIGPDDNVGIVHDRLMDLGATLTIETLNAIVAGNLKTIPQEQLLTDGEEPTPAPKIFRDTCKIDWTNDSAKIHNHIRGLSPYPAANTVLHIPDATPIEMKILESRRTDKTIASEPGTIVNDGKKLYVACGNNTAIEITRLQAAGRKAMPVADYLRGTQIPSNSFFN